MLYLAEVQKKTRAFGGSKAEFKLLACQRAENSWSAVGEEVIPAPDDSQYNAGALVLVDLTGNRSVQRVLDAGKQLVVILQNFSRLQDKFKSQEEEIEQWKQSLTYQSQELNRREMEMEARQEQLQDAEADLEKIDAERQEIELAKTEVEKLQEEFNRKSQDLEGAWAQLSGERRRFEEQVGEAQQSAGLDVEQAQRIQELLEQLSHQGDHSAPVGAALEQINLLLGQQQEVLDRCWGELEQQRQAAQQTQVEIDQGQGSVSWDEWYLVRDTWLKAQATLVSERELLQSKQATLSLLTASVQQQNDLHQTLSQLATGGSSDDPNVGKIDIEALEQMPIEQLQAIVQDLKQDLEKNSRFVSSQEEELAAQQQDINAIKERIAAANEYDRLQLETELSDEQESYNLLNETLVGQRRNLQEREAILLNHETVLARRQGLPLPGGASEIINLDPIVAKVEQITNQLTEEISKLEEQIKVLEEAIAQQDGLVQQQGQEVEQQRSQLSQQEQEWVAKQTSTAELWGKVNTYQDVLQPFQDSLNGMREKANELTEISSQLKTISDHQSGAIASIQETIQSLTTGEAPQLAAS